MVHFSVLANIQQLAVASSPAIALRHLGERGTVDYGRLCTLVDERIARLRGLSPHPATVAVRADKTTGTIAQLLALTALGHSVVLLAPELGAEAVRRVCGDANCAYLMDADDRADPLAAARPASAPAQRLILTTSGTTGTPKVVPLPAPALRRFFAWAATRFDLSPGTRVLSYAPLNFDVSLLDLWCSLAVGAEVILVPASRATDDAWLTKQLETNVPQVIQAVPGFFRSLVNAGCLPLGEVRQVLVTGDTFTAELARDLVRLFPCAAIHNVYGCTETNDSFLHTLTPADLHRDLVPIGHPIAGVQARVVDERGDELTGAEVTGELLVGTPFQSTGYLGAAGAHPAFVPAAGDSGPLYRTRDVVHRDAGGLYHLVGRSDHIVKVRGVRTSIAEVEAALHRQPLVREAAVVAEPDVREGVRLHAFVVHSAPLDRLAFRAGLARELPATALPAVYHFGGRSLPRTSTGKVDRARLPLSS